MLFLIVGAVFACIPLLYSGATAIYSVWHILIIEESYYYKKDFGAYLRGNNNYCLSSAGVIGAI